MLPAVLPAVRSRTAALAWLLACLSLLSVLGAAPAQAAWDPPITVELSFSPAPVAHLRGGVTARLVRHGAGIPAGWVSFSVGDEVQSDGYVNGDSWDHQTGTATARAAGTLTFPTGGTHTVHAVFRAVGTAEVAAQSAPVRVEVPGSVPTTTSIVPVTNPSPARHAVGLRLLVQQADGYPARQGTVRLQVDGREVLTTVLDPARPFEERVLVLPEGVSGDCGRDPASTGCGLSAGDHEVVALFDGAPGLEPSSARLVQQVTPGAASTLTTTTDRSTARVTEPVTVTATVAGAGGTTPGGGHVRVLDGDRLVAWRAVRGTTTEVPVRLQSEGAHRLSVQYTGDRDLEPSASASVHDVDAVPDRTTTTAVDVPEPGYSGGDGVLLCARSTTADDVEPARQLFTLSLDGRALTTGTANEDGRRCVRPVLPRGEHTVTATRTAHDGYASSSTSVPLRVVDPYPVSVVVDPPERPRVAYGDTVAWHATVTATAGTPGHDPDGRVHFSLDGRLLGGALLDERGRGSLTRSYDPSSCRVDPTLCPPRAGTHRVTATYGSPGFAVTGSSPQQYEITPAATATSLAVTPSPSAAGRSTTLSAHVSGPDVEPLTGAVEFRDGGELLATVDLDRQASARTTTSALAAGPHALTATYTGDHSRAASSAGAEHTVVPPVLPAAVSDVRATPGHGSALVAWSPPDDGGSPITRYTVTASPGGRTTTTGGATSVLLDGLAPGTAYAFVVSATTAVGTGPDGAASDAVVPLAPGPTTTTLSSDPQPSAAGAAVALLARVTGPAPVPAGTVVFRDGDQELSTVEVAADGTARATSPPLVPGRHALTATYGGDAAHSSSTGSVSHLVLPPAPTVVPVVRAAAGIERASVSWSALPDGGSPPTGWRVRVSPGGRTVTTDGPTSTVVDGLTAGTGHTFAVQALGAGGPGPWSAPSRSVVPRAPQPAVRDYDGDGDPDLAVWRPSTGTWRVRGVASTPHGRSGDVPVPGDYDGNGTTDLAVWHPSTGTWHVRGRPTVAWGRSGDVPLPGDYDGNGTTDLAVWRPSTGTWWVRGAAGTPHGRRGDVPVPGDYDGNGTTDLAVWRPSTGTWHVRGRPTVAWGRSGDRPVPADHDGDGTTDLAVWRPSTGTWWVRGGATTHWGRPGDVPLGADVDGDGRAELVCWRPGDGTWYVRGGTYRTWGVRGDVPL